MAYSVYPALLRKLPAAVSYKLWMLFGRHRRGQHFWYQTSVYGRARTYGGVVGFSSDALFVDLNDYEEEAFELVKYGLETLWRDSSSVQTIDVGANNGQWMLKLDALDTRFSITCFEPFTQLCQFLEELKARNDIKQVVIHQMAVDQNSGQQIIHHAPGATDTASIDPKFIASQNKQQFTVETVSLDDYCKDASLGPDLIKIDVELFECEVLAGAGQVLKTDRPMVIFESLHTTDPVMLAKHETIRTQLAELDYQLFRVINDPQLKLIPGLETDPSYRFNNFAALPSEHLPMFMPLVETR